jgi:hypothetical protein
VRLCLVVERPRDRGVPQLREGQLLARRHHVHSGVDRFLDLGSDRLEARSGTEENDVPPAAGRRRPRVQLAGGGRDRVRNVAASGLEEGAQVLARLFGSRVGGAQDLDPRPADDGASDLDPDRSQPHERDARNGLVVHSPPPARQIYLEAAAGTPRRSASAPAMKRMSDATAAR